MSAGVYTKELDLSNIVPAVATSIGAMTVFSDRGPVGPNLVTITKQIVDEYGNPVPGNNFHYSALAFLQRSNILWVNRVVNAALYGGVEIKKDGSALPNTAISGTTDPEAHTFGTDGLLAIFCPDPGAWNNNIAFRITNINNTDKEFDIEMYEKDRFGVYQPVPGTPVTVSRQTKKDGFGRDMYVGDLYAMPNKKFIVIDNTTEADTVLPKAQATNLLVTGGDNGSPVTVGQIVTGWDAFANSEEYTINILMQCGIGDEVVGQKIDEVCRITRKDCCGILDVPYGLDTTGSVNYKRNDLSLDSSYSALYASWLKIYDPYNDKYIYVCPSGYLGGVYAYTDEVNDPWFAPAGMNRGILTVLGLSKIFTKGERDVLYMNNINPIRKHPAGGIVVWGQKTLQSKPSALDRMNVRRLLLVLEKAISTALEYWVFEPNDSFTRIFITNMIDSYMRGIVARRGVYDYKIVCNESNNTGEIIDRNELWVDLYIKPVKAAEFIQLRVIITRTNANFDEVIGTVNAGSAIA